MFQTFKNQPPSWERSIPNDKDIYRRRERASSKEIYQGAPNFVSKNYTDELMISYNGCLWIPEKLFVGGMSPGMNISVFFLVPLTSNLV